MVTPMQGDIWWAEADDQRRPVLIVNPDYSGFPHTEACNACSTRVSG